MYLISFSNLSQESSLSILLYHVQNSNWRVFLRIQYIATLVRGVWSGKNCSN